MGFLKQLKGYNYTTSLYGTGNFEYNGRIYDIPQGWMKLPGDSKTIHSIDELITYMFEIDKTMQSFNNKNIQIDVLQTYLDNVAGVEGWIKGAFPEKAGNLVDIREALNFTLNGVIPRVIMTSDYQKFAGTRPLNYKDDIWVFQLYYQILVNGRKYSDILHEATNINNLDEIVEKFMYQQFKDIDEVAIRNFAKNYKNPEDALLRDCRERIGQKYPDLSKFFSDKRTSERTYLTDALLFTYIARKAEPLLEQFRKILSHYIEIEEGNRAKERNDRLFGKQGDTSPAPIWSVQEEIDKLLKSFSEWKEPEKKQ